MRNVTYVFNIPHGIYIIQTFIQGKIIKRFRKKNFSKYALEL